MKILFVPFALLLFITVNCAGAARAAIPAPPVSEPGQEQFAAIAGIVKAEIEAGRIPGAVILVGNRERVLYRQAFGFRALVPEKLPMTVDTVFDLASLTKVVATTTAIMQLIEQGQLALDQPVARYWPEFAGNGKERITVRQLLTHYSGLRPDLPARPAWRGYARALDLILAERPTSPPGSRYMYSDINFEVLGELVHRLSGEPLNVYCRQRIFEPLAMTDTLFLPPSSLCDRIAPTQNPNNRGARKVCGEVHDPTGLRMGGVAGHAGLFSTADDLAIFARMLLELGTYNGREVLGPSQVALMTSPQSPEGGDKLRGLGWELGPVFATNLEELPTFGSFGHKGYTGTEIRIDPVRGVYLIILTNRVYLNGKGDAQPLRKNIGELLAGSLGPLPPQPLQTAGDADPGSGSAAGGNSASRAEVRTGIDVLREEDFTALAGLRVGLITNHTGLDREGRRTLDLVRQAANLQLVALFSPEHGLAGTRDELIASSTESASGLPVYSLYGKDKRPTEQMLAGLDALVFDVQDAGARFYTYITTMAYAMEAAARQGIPFYVLDRPNPINARLVQGPVLDENLKSFTGYFPLPVRHGMTVGELAGLFNQENRIGADLHVVKMRGYNRDAWFDETGLAWVNPSPNLRSLTQAILYPGTGLIEGANLSVGRGTATPFELVGAPWINGQRLAGYLAKRNIKGVRFSPAEFTPESSNFARQPCQGIRIELQDREALDPTLLGIEIAAALYRLYPAKFKLDHI
ncbi:MAG TPA: exo-beta-N-acetylmuramidase NamZ domain-containing protein, partial [Desulfurivibrionaceae bacterium]|nr:exo-beta-N-acetylmuramidase NamZ domain-containing protein [Desulfurivibrionaceae bacterium]